LFRSGCNAGWSSPAFLWRRAPLVVPTWQKLAALPQEEQEERIEAAKRGAEAAVDGSKRVPRGFGGPDEWFTRTTRMTLRLQGKYRKFSGCPPITDPSLSTSP
jgi:hypothetical protein